ncbi:MAG: GntR family transcriptional regulator [Thermoguttaceae bacterium]
MKEDDSVNPLGPLARGALRHHVVQRLLRAIIQGQLAAGTRLIANKLAVQLGVSATPIREALVELEQSGVVELLHHRGALVKPFGPAELRDFFAVRRLLECEAVRLACGHVDHELLCLLRCDLQRIVGASANGREKWVKDLLAVDHRIHLMPVEHCGNKRLIAEIKRYDSLGQTMRDMLGYDCAWHHETIDPLVDLLDAMQNQRAEAGAAAMERHISNIATMLEKVMFDGHEDSTIQ